MYLFSIDMWQITTNFAAYNWNRLILLQFLWVGRSPHTALLTPLLRVSQGCSQSLSRAFISFEKRLNFTSSSFWLLVKFLSLWLYEREPWLFAGCCLEAVLETAHRSLPYDRLNKQFTVSGICFSRASKRLSLSSLLRQSLLWHKVIRIVKSHYLCHILLVRRKWQVPPVLKERGLFKSTTHWGSS